MRPQRVQQSEVVVLGAGVAGLLIASQLSESHHVTLIERAANIPLTKYWLTDAKCAEAWPELISCIDCPYQSLDFIAYDGGVYRCYGEYLLWNTEKIVEYLKRDIYRKGGEILTGHTFYSYRVRSSNIRIMINDYAVEAKLAIDCMGYSSPIVYESDVVEILGYYLLYGATFPATERIDPVGLHNMMINKNPSYIEAFPTSDNKLHLILIVPEKNLRPIRSLADSFSFIINSSPYSHLIDYSAGKSNFLGGTIPVGRLKRRALDRIFFFGEAGQANPAATATALTRMLYSCKPIAEFLSARIADDKLRSRDIGDPRLDVMSHFDRRFQVNLFHEILGWSSKRFAEVVQEMGRLQDHQLINSVMFGQNVFSSIFNLKSIRRLIHLNGKNILRNAIKSVAKTRV